MSEFHREDRYIVIKRSDMEKLPADTRRNFQGRCRSFYEQMLIAGAPARRFLVIESDWPEYEPVWQMIERRVTGNDIPAAETMGYSVIGNRYMIALTQQEILDHSQSYAGCMFELVARSALDAQRLRADTAEAERDGAKAANAVLREELRTERLRADAAVGDANEAERMLAAADTAEAEVARLREAATLSAKVGAPNFHSMKRELAAAEQRNAELSANNQQLRKLLEQTLAALNPSAKLSKSIRVALNPNPEAESHE